MEKRLEWFSSDRVPQVRDLKNTWEIKPRNRSHYMPDQVIHDDWEYMPNHARKEVLTIYDKKVHIPNSNEIYDVPLPPEFEI